MGYLRIFFGDWIGGRLGRVPFLLASLAIWAVLLLAGAAAGPIVPEDPGAEVGSGTLVLIFLFALLSLVAMAASFNIAAKRLRDIGLPGWWTLLGLTVLSTVLLVTVPAYSYPWFSILVFAALCLVPSGAAVRAGGS